jgi:hypothetical protein
MNRLHHKRHTSQERVRPRLSLVTTPPATGSAPHHPGAHLHELQLTFGQLALIYKSLQSVKTRGVLPLQDELLNDTIELVDQALNRAVWPASTART